jgi:hypothetical protein
MIVKFDTPELAKKRFEEILELRRKQLGEVVPATTLFFCADFDEFRAVYRLHLNQIKLVFKSKPEGVTRLTEVMRMQSLMMEV